MTITVIQKRPNTCVAISTVDETQYVGFSKVCWPDTWDSRTGLFVALGKAAADMFEIKVPKSGRMDVHLLSDPRPGIQTKGEHELEELLDQWSGQDAPECVTETVSCLDFPVGTYIPDHRTEEEKQDDKRRKDLADARFLHDEGAAALEAALHIRAKAAEADAVAVAEREARDRLAEERAERWKAEIKQIRSDQAALRKMVDELFLAGH